MTKNEATQAALACQQRLRCAFDCDWTIDVWENMGWHWAVFCDRMVVRPTHSPFLAYAARVSEMTAREAAQRGFGHPVSIAHDLSTQMWAATPEGAVQHAARFAYAQLRRQQRRLQVTRDAMSALRDFAPTWRGAKKMAKRRAR